jgi:hydrogenase maturation protease
VSRILIIGYGNPLRGDDGFGFLAAERLRETIDDPDIEILALHQLTPELMEPVSRAGRVIFIDAAAEGEPGKLVIKPVAAGPGAAAAFTHFADPGALLAGAGRLYGNVPPGTMVTVPGLDFELGSPLSEPVRAALEFLVLSAIHPLLSV